MKTGKYSTLGKNLLLFTISSFGSKVISFLLVPLYTAVLSTSDYGSLDLVTTTVQLLIPLMTLNIQDAVLRFALDKEYNKQDVLKVSSRINLLAGSILGIVLIMIHLGGIIEGNSYYLIFLFGQYLFGAICNTLQMYMKAKDKVAILTIGGIGNTFIAGVLNILLLLVFKFGVNGYMIANSAGLIAFDIFVWFAGGANKDFREGRVRRVLFRVMIKYSSPLIVSSLAWWINSASDRYVLTAFKGTAENGLYSVAYKIPTILSTITGIFYNAWSVSAIAEFDKEDTDGFIGNTFSVYSTLSVVVCSIVMLFNIPLARLLYAKDFYNAWRFVPFLLVGTAFNGLALFEGCIFGAVKQTKSLSKTTLMGAIVNTLLNFVLIYYFGAIGAAIATMVGYIVSFIARTYLLGGIVKMKTSWNKHYICYSLLVFQSIVSLNKDGWKVGLVISIMIFAIYRKYIKLLIHKIICRTGVKTNH